MSRASVRPATRTSRAVTLRPAREADQPFLRALFEQARPYLQLIPLPPEQLRALIDLQWRAQVQGYAAMHPAAEGLVIEHRSAPVGRLIIDHGARLEIVDIAIWASERNCGLGSAALHAVLDLADERGRDVRLCVATDNPAQRLYDRLGFREVGRTGADIVMERRAT